MLFKLNFLKNWTWFMIPANIAIILVLIKGFRETFSKEYSLLTIVWFGLAILMCLCFDVYFYHKLKEITLKSAEAQLKAMKDE